MRTGPGQEGSRACNTGQLEPLLRAQQGRLRELETPCFRLSGLPTPSPPLAARTKKENFKGDFQVSRAN